MRYNARRYNPDVALGYSSGLYRIRFEVNKTLFYVANKLYCYNFCAIIIVFNESRNVYRTELWFFTENAMVSVAIRHNICLLFYSTNVGNFHK